MCFPTRTANGNRPNNRKPAVGGGGCRRGGMMREQQATLRYGVANSIISFSLLGLTKCAMVGVVLERFQHEVGCGEGGDCAHPGSDGFVGWLNNSLDTLLCSLCEPSTSPLLPRCPQFPIRQSKTHYTQLVRSLDGCYNQM